MIISKQTFRLIVQAMSVQDKAWFIPAVYELALYGCIIALYCCNTMIYIALQSTVAGFVRARDAFCKKTHD